MSKIDRQKRRQQWAARVADFRASGQSMSAWCAKYDLKVHQLQYWLKKYPQTTAADTPTRWLPLDQTPVSEPVDSPLVVRVGRAAVEVRPGFSETLLRDVLRVLTP